MSMTRRYGTWTGSRPMRCKVCGATDLPVLSEEIRDGSGRVFYCAACDLGLLEFDESFDLAAYYKDQYWKTHGPSLGKTASYQDLFESYVNYQGRRIELMRPHLGAGVRL